jgi:D-serine deaminase-like pyridoxal phosphate-dependent protein
VSDANQEHGIVSRRGEAALDVSQYPVGTRLRILPNHACATGAQHDAYHVLPNHACATGAQHDAYHVVRGGTEVVDRWPRFGGW